MLPKLIPSDKLILSKAPKDYIVPFGSIKNDTQTPEI